MKKYCGVFLLVVFLLIIFLPKHVFSEGLPAISPESSITLDEVVVSSSPITEDLSVSKNSVLTLSGENLKRQMGRTIAETLGSEPGIASSTFGSAVSRPVIRGLGGDRVKILENGIGSQDVSNTSPDHAVAIEPALIENIEVIRGPATLLYGASAIGGVVNSIDDRIPKEIPEAPLKAKVEMRKGTVDHEQTALGKLNIPSDRLIFHFDAFKKDTNDIKIPGFARTERERQIKELEFEEPRDKIRFSDSTSDSVALGSSYILDNGYVGFAINNYNNNYGIPNGENNVSIDSNRKRLDFQGKIEEMEEFWKSIEWKMGVIDYEHTEYEGIEEGTKFYNNAIESRIELKHNPIGIFEGMVGLQHQRSDFKATGEEAFQPPTKTDIYSGFIFEELPIVEKLNFQFGGRLDYHELDSETNDLNISRNFLSLSNSVGINWQPLEKYSIGLSIAKTNRAPNGQELFANGPHISTSAYEVGDVDLNKEKATGIDVQIKKTKGTVNGMLGGFYNKFNRYIGLVRSGEVLGDLNKNEYKAFNADFIGFESQIAVQLFGDEGLVNDSDNSIYFFLQPDYVRANNVDDNTPLARINPLRIKSGINFEKKNLLKGDITLQHVFSQNRVSEFETTSPSYTFLNIGLNKTIEIEKTKIELFVKANNILDAKARDHTSFIKDIAPLPGANVIFGIRMDF